MSRFLESICVINGELQRLFWHQRRLDQTLRAFYEGVTIDLHAALHADAAKHTGTVKCRVLYDRHISGVQFSPYVPRPVNTLKLIEANDLDYRFKFSDRMALERAFDRRGTADDILIVKNGRITDTSIANVAFRRGAEWFTPRQPLLNGTMREFLLANGTIQEADIDVRDVASFDGCKLFNALLGFPSDEFPVSNIHF